MKPNFTLEELKQEVIRLANQYPDTVYLGTVYPVEYNKNRLICYYTKGSCADGEGCIFGRAILNLDPNLKEFLVQQDSLNQNNNDAGIINVLKKLGFNDPILDTFARVQVYQDIERCWKDAVDCLKNLE